MKEQIDFSSRPNLEKFSKLVSDTFSSSLSAIISKEAAFNLSESYKCSPDVLLDGYGTDGAFVKAKEENTNFEIGFLVKIRDITMFADLMLAGDGEGKDVLDDDVKDAAKELASQMLSSLNVPIEGAFKKKFSIKVEDILPCTSAQGSFNAIGYTVFDYLSNVIGKQEGIRFFMDDALVDYIDTKPAKSSDEGSAGARETNYSQDSGASSGDGHHHASQNLDLLLDIDMPVSVRMGTARLFLKDILGLGPGNIVELEQNADEPIELVVNEKVIARGEVVIVDGYFGFRIKEILSKMERLKKLKD